MHVTPYICFVLIISIVLFRLAQLSRLRILKALMYCCSFASVCMFFELVLLNETFKFFFNQIKLFGVVFIAPLTLLLYLTFLKLHKLYTRLNIAILSVIPFITLIMILTNPFHHLFLVEYYVENTPVLSYMYFTPGVWFWIYSIYSYIIVFCAVVVLFVGCFKKPVMYRGQNYAMMLGASVAVFINALVIFGFFTDYGDVSIIAFGLAAICHYWGLFIYRPVKMIMQARTLALQEISNPSLIFDYTGSLIDKNIAASQLFGEDTASNISAMTNIGADDFVKDDKTYQVTEKKLFSRTETYLGKVVIFNDITEIKNNVSKLSFALSHDPLTGMHSRDTFFLEIKKKMRAGNLPLTLVVVNICGVRTFNNIFGYDFGNDLINTVSKMILKILPENTLCSRTNGDEFGIALPETLSYECFSEQLTRESSKTKFDGAFIGLYIGNAIITSKNDNIDHVFKNAFFDSYRQKQSLSISYYNSLFKSFEDILKTVNVPEAERISRTKKLLTDFSNEAKLTDAQKERLMLLAVTCNIGLFNMKSNLVKRKGSLTNVEWEDYKTHTVRGYNIALTTMELAVVADEILHHHERYDGFGYPNRLKGNDIPYLSRIIAVADYYDEITCQIKRKKTHIDAVDDILSKAGACFDPDIVDVFCKIWTES